MGTLRSSFILAVLLAASPAAAEVDIAKADKLFAEGLALRDSNLEQSCTKFEESLAYNPQAIGTLLNVALCDEKLGRIASAVAKFSEARDRAKEQQLDQHIKAATEHLEVLVPELPYLTIKFAAAPLPDTKILIDSNVIALDKIAKLPVDPGERVIVVSAPGRLPFQTKIVITKRELKEIEVPELAKSVTVKSSRRTIGKITTVSGIATIATGVVLGLVAKRNYDAEFDDSLSDPCIKPPGEKAQCPADRQPTVEKARTLGNVGTAVSIVGVAAAGVGLYLWMRAPAETSEPRVSVVPVLSPDGAGLSAIGRF